MRGGNGPSDEATGNSTDMARRLEMLTRASQLLSSTLDYRTTLENVASLVATHLADWCTISLSQPDGSVERVAGSHRDPAKRSLIVERLAQWPDPTEESQPLLFEVLATGAPRLLSELGQQTLETIGKDEDQRRLLVQLRARSLLVAPMLTSEATIGALFMARDDSRERFTEEDADLALELGRRAGTALENARLHEEMRRLNAELERRVRERTAELEDANRRLQEQISVRRRTEAELLERERLLRRAQRITQMGSWSWRPKEGRLVWSEETCRIFGYPVTIEPTFDLYLICVVPEDRERVLSLVTGAVEDRKPFEFEHGFVRVDDSVGFARCDGEVTLGPDGSVVEVFGTIQDVTKARAAEEKIRESEARFRFLAENSLHVVATVNRDGLIEYVSPSAVQVLGYEPHQLEGSHCLDLLHPDEREDAARRFLRLVGNPGESYSMRYRYRHGTGEWRTLEMQGKLPDRDSDSAIINAHDVTERVRAEEAIRALNSELERRSAQLAATNKELETFAYSVSHDLRAPLRAIDGFSRVLEEDYAGKMEPDAARYLERIRSGAKRMSDLIDDLLALSRLSRAHMERRDIDVSALVRQVVDEVVRRHPDREVEIIVEEGMYGNADPRLLTVVLDNLIDNSLKFTRRSERPRVEVGCLPGEEPVYFVRDNGAGFDMAYAGRLFGAFQRLHSQDDFEGTGIGLATVQRIINRHGGSIRAEGTLGEGATFYFSLGEGPASVLDGDAPEHGS